jgi:hypothetical protein
MVEWEMSDEEFERQYVEATRRGEEALRTEPRAKAAHYDPASGRVVIELLDGCTFTFPVYLAQGLADATPEQLAEIRILGPGTALDWPQLDMQFSVTGLLAGRFGNAKWMERLAQQRAAA